MEVSALGFGCMGMTYNRSAHPGKRECIALIRSAAERGVTLFDTAIIYGPLNTEELAGEALEALQGEGRAHNKIRARGRQRQGHGQAGQPPRNDKAILRRVPETP